MQGIGNTPLIRLSSIVTEDCADIYVKYEGANPTGSMKDRMALSMIEDAFSTARDLAIQEGIFGGITSGANVWAALQRAREIGPGKKIVTVIIDSGLKYLNSDLYE